MKPTLIQGDIMQKKTDGLFYVRVVVPDDFPGLEQGSYICGPFDSADEAEVALMSACEALAHANDVAFKATVISENTTLH